MSLLCRCCVVDVSLLCCVRICLCLWLWLSRSSALQTRSGSITCSKLFSDAATDFRGLSVALGVVNGMGSITVTTSGGALTTTSVSNLRSIVMRSSFTLSLGPITNVQNITVGCTTGSAAAVWALIISPPDVVRSKSIR